MIGAHMFYGFLNVNKPAGISSAAALARIKPLVRPAKLGHAGTLDPLASGVLIVALGQATRLIDRVQQMPKRYRATFRLGCRSASDDIESELIALSDALIPDRAALDRAAAALVGVIQQRPPAFSAVKVDGRRAYALARRGELVELAARPVEIHQLDVIEYEYPQLVLDIRCGSGTYVRSLGRDLAESLGTAAVMTDLVRTAIGPFALGDACVLGKINAASLAGYLHPALRAVEATLRTVALSDHAIGELSNGLAVVAPVGLRPATSDEEFAAVDGHGSLAAIVRFRGDGMLTPKLNFTAAEPRRPAGES